MAKLYITEYHDLPQAFSNSAPQLVREPGIVDQPPITIGASAAQSAPFQTSTRLVRLHTDVICSVLFGPPASTTATANNQRLAANQTEYKMVIDGAGHCVSVITNT
jgi:hypothetical protein